MITLDILVANEAGLSRLDIEHWIREGWVRPREAGGGWAFDEIDVARLHLIRVLRHEYRIEEEALPLVLGLLDQLYDQRRRLRRLCNALARTAPPELRAALHAALLGEDEADDRAETSPPA